MEETEEIQIVPANLNNDGDEDDDDIVLNLLSLDHVDETIIDETEIDDEVATASNLYGWKRKPEYNDCQSFSTLHCLPTDLLHDMFEGVISYDLPYMIRKRCQPWGNFHKNCKFGEI